MKRREPTGGTRRIVRVEWEFASDGRGRVYLFGVRSFGDYGNDRTCFQTGAGCVTVSGEELTVRTFCSGGVELTGRIDSVTVTGREGKDRAAD